MSMLADLVEVVIGVDTHKDTHTAALLDTRTGGVLARITVTTAPDGYAQLVALAEQHSGLRAWALEGSGGYGAGLARHLVGAGELVVELDRPLRPARRGGAKSDPIDAERAARDALARARLAQPKTGAQRAALQVRLTARRAAVEASADAQRQLHALVITAPEVVRARFRGQSTRIMLTTATRLRPTSSADVEVLTSLTVLRDLARRVRFLEAEAEAAEHEKAIRAIVRSWRPDLLQLTGVGPIVAATVLTAWSHPGRCRDDAAFAMLAGAAPIPASSGKTVRYRLNRSGDRQLNRALHTIVLTRLQRDERTRAYADRRRAQGKTDREIKRCLKRYVAREIYRHLETTPQPLDAA
ncbi:IS110 family transposase [Micromonospora haikouensis]|uniref:IS110 family transposase n=1 Tax=Micromonospora haikouensis TaxID=686309 RepID=UPI0036C29CB2